jgi:hypothetical protein
MKLTVVLAVLVVALAAAPAASAASSISGGGTVVSSIGAGASPPPCSDDNYNFLGPGAAWGSTLGWRFRQSSVPSGLSASGVLDKIKKSFRNVVNSRNDCGMADQVSATQSYLGTTGLKPGISRSGSCTGMDGHNVVGFAPLDGGFSGYTCIWWNGSNEIVEADMRLDTNTAWALTLSSCNAELMMEALVTHEVGHAYGLDHVGESNHGRQTMSVFIDALCGNQEATLGRGDVLGLRALY